MAQKTVPQQKTTILNKYGEKLVGLLHETGSNEIVVLCHGFRCTKDSNTIVKLADAIAKEGISVFRFDFAGNGVEESDGPFQYGNYGNYWREAEDLNAVVKYLMGANRMISAVIGHSKGANIVLLYASKYHDVHKVVSVSGPYYLKKGIRSRLGKNFLERIQKDGFIDVRNRAGELEYRVTEESLMERLNINMHEACLSIDEKCRVLIVHGSADTTVPISDAREFSIIRNHKLHIIEGADHGYSSHQTELAAAVLSFINEAL